MILDEHGRAMVPVLECQGDSEAHVALSFLESQGISARLNSEVPHDWIPLTVDGLGKVQVLVTEDDAVQAFKLLEDQRRSVLLEEEE